MATALGLPLSPVPWNWAGVVLSTLLFGCALAYMWALGRQFLDEKQAWVVTALCAVSPFSVFFGLPYTESLYLLACVASTFHLTNHRHGRAALWGTIAGLTRPNGFLLSVLLASVVLGERQRGHWVRRAATALSPAIGTALYSVHVWVLTGSPFTWADAQEGWGRAVQMPWEALGGWLVQVSAPLDFAASAPADFLNGLAGWTALLLALPITRRFGLGYGAFIVVNVLLAVTGGGIPSLGRYTSVLFPLYLYVGGVFPRQHVPALLLASASAAAFVAGMFFTWRPIY